jgi:hypothetical protein
MKDLFKTLIVTTSLTLSINYGAELAESTNPTQHIEAEVVRSTDLEIWRQTALSHMICTGRITAQDIVNLLAYEPRSTYEKGALLVIDLVLLMQHPYLCPRTAEELRTFKLREAIEDREDLSLVQKRILLAFLPEATMVDQFNASELLFQRLGGGGAKERDFAKTLMLGIAYAGHTARIQELTTLVGIEETQRIHALENEQHITLKAAEWLQQQKLHQLAKDAYQVIIESEGTLPEDKQEAERRLAEI